MSYEQIHTCFGCGSPADGKEAWAIWSRGKFPANGPYENEPPIVCLCATCLESAEERLGGPSFPYTLDELIAGFIVFGEKNE